MGTSQLSVANDDSASGRALSNQAGDDNRQQEILIEERTRMVSDELSRQDED